MFVSLQAARLDPSLLGTCALGKWLGQLLRRHEVIQTDDNIDVVSAPDSPRSFANASQEACGGCTRPVRCGRGRGFDLVKDASSANAAARAVSGAPRSTHAC